MRLGHLGWLFVVGVVFQLTACAASQPVIGDPAAAFDRAEVALQEGRYEEAATYLERTLELGVRIRWLPRVQPRLAEAYCQAGAYDHAAEAYERLIEWWPSHPLREEAYFRRAVSRYRLAPGSSYDPGPTVRALEALRDYVYEVPSCPRCEEVGAMIDTLRHRLARRRFEAAAQYEQLGHPRSAAITYVAVFEEYPETDLAPRALDRAIQAYCHLAATEGIPRDRVEARRLFRKRVSLFSRSPLSPGRPLPSPCP